jgi:hypothetical protein
MPFEITEEIKVVAQVVTFLAVSLQYDANMQWYYIYKVECKDITIGCGTF